MGISQQIGASSLIKPGVIDNTAARPASPYEGQVIFQKDTDQLLVWNGTAWVIPNSPAQNPTGLELITTVTGSSPTTTIDVNNVFSSQYNAYRIVISGGTATGIVTGAFQLLDSGGTPSATEYYEVFMYSTFNSSGVSTANTNAGTRFLRAAAAVNGNDCFTGSFDVMNPFLAKLTHYYNASNPAGGNGGISIGYHNVATSYTGFRITASVTNGISGTAVSVYGYRK
jgi:hypothetical protein